MYLFDTDTLSNVVKRKPSGRLLEKLEETPIAFQHTSAINVGEIYYGANRSSKKKQILKAFEEMVFPNVNIFPNETTKCGGTRQSNRYLTLAR